jgi:hypothetical protein
MGPDDVAPTPSPAEGATDPQPWITPELRTLSASGAELGGGGLPDIDGSS